MEVINNVRTRKADSGIFGNLIPKLSEEDKERFLTLAKTWLTA
jgi:hypothetical protein